MEFVSELEFFLIKVVLKVEKSEDYSVLDVIPKLNISVQSH